jgi:hypothetical protein
MAKRSRNKGKSPATRQSKHPGMVQITNGTETCKSDSISWFGWKTASWKQLLQALIIVGAGIWIYWPVLHGDWLWDDDYLISQNQIVHDPYGIWTIWLNPETQIDYFPLTVSVEWLEWQFWPGNTFPYHCTNVVLHIVSSLLVWRLLSKFGLRLAWLGGLCFAIHPIMVESVAWMAEMKNTLSMPPFLLAMCAWIDYERKGKPEDFFLTLFLFVVAMLCKTTMVMFPIIILLYAWWKRGRILGTDLKNSAPFFAVSLAIGLALVIFEHFGVGGQPIPLGGFFSRIAGAGLSLSFYFSKFFLPIDLLPIYPQWNIDPPSLGQFLPWPVLGVVIYWLWLRREDWGRHALLGLGFFLINLIPFIGFRPITFMRYSWVADHFIYLPMLGLLGLIVAALDQINSRLPISARPATIGFVALLAILLTWGSHRYAKMFVNLETLWTYTIQHNPGSWSAHNNLGYALTQSGQLKEAQDQFEEALRINPNYAEAHNNLGCIFDKIGRPSEAVSQYKESLRLYPGYIPARMNLARHSDPNSAQTAPVQK